MTQRKNSPLLLMISFFALLMILFNPTLRNGLADMVGALFYPLIGFNHDYPILTIFTAGSIVIIISTLLRHFAIDWKEMAKMQKIMSKFQREFREARVNKNTYKIKKMEKLQPQLMQKQSQAAGGQMKLMPITMFIFIPIFTWIWIFLSGVSHHYFTVPWAENLNLFDRYAIFSYWILLYMLLSIPLTQVLQYALKIASWSKRPQTQKE
jgi:uncharacterized membrane protein (DUF106 family)